MSQYTVGAIKSFPSTAAMSKYARVVMNAGVLALASATQHEIGIFDEASFATSSAVNKPVRLRSAEGTTPMIASGAISQYAAVYAAANGKIASSGTVFVGYAMEAASADGDIIEVLRAGGANSPVAGVASGYKLARGQLTTVTASDTVVTGLSTVVIVVATLDSDPIDNPEWVSASIGDQAGTPAAGSVLIKTWQNTAGNDPTPTAATTFGKKVNWLAVGT